MAQYVSDTPPQIPADSTGSIVKAAVNFSTPVHSHTYVIKKVTPNGTDGSMVITDGKVTSWSKPT